MSSLQELCGCHQFQSISTVCRWKCCVVHLLTGVGIAYSKSFWWHKVWMVSIQSNVCQTYRKVCFRCRGVFYSFCTTVLNSTGWNSFLTSFPLCLLVQLLLCVQYIFYILVLLLLDSLIWRRLSTNTSCPQGDFPLILPCSWTGFALSFYGLLPSLSSRTKGNRHCLPITQAHSNSFTQLLKLQ